MRLQWSVGGSAWDQRVLSTTSTPIHPNITRTSRLESTIQWNYYKPADSHPYERQSFISPGTLILRLLQVDHVYLLYQRSTARKLSLILRYWNIIFFLLYLLNVFCTVRHFHLILIEIIFLLLFLFFPDIDSRYLRKQFLFHKFQSKCLSHDQKFIM